ncbi:MAG: hypothetical protein ABIP21_00235 [Acidimicrobiia bacterium]
MTARKEETAAKGDVAKQIDKETEQGFVGVKVDPIDDAEYTLTTGPNSPGGHADDRTRTDQIGA